MAISKKRREMIDNNPFISGKRPTCCKCGERIYAWQVNGEDIEDGYAPGLKQHKICLSLDLASWKYKC